MPLHDTELLVAPQQLRIEVSIEPVHNAIYSLLLLYKADHMPGVTDWVTRTITAMAPDLRRRHAIVVNGLFYAIEPQHSYADFASYFEGLVAAPAEVLRDRVLLGSCEPRGARENVITPDIEKVLSSSEAYLGFLRAAFPDTELDIPVERGAYALLREPERMQAVIVEHLREMWHRFLEREWVSVQPMLQESVSALQRIQIDSSRPFDAARAITGQDLSGSKWQQLVDAAQRIVFVPSAHVGPYLGKFFREPVLWLLFGARLPEGVPAAASAVSRSELTVRLSALNDDTRLRILALIGQQGELCAPEVMAKLGLSQSATSRHLQQLSASGFLNERRREGAKCYQLNRERVGETFGALERYIAS